MFTNADLVAAVRDHATKHYNEGGWDYLVECWEDSDIIEWLDDAATPAEAIARIAKVVSLLDERRREVTNEIF